MDPQLATMRRKETLEKINVQASLMLIEVGKTKVFSAQTSETAKCLFKREIVKLFEYHTLPKNT